MRNAGRLRALLLTVALVATGATLAPSASVAASCPGGLASCVVVSVVSTENFNESIEEYVVGGTDLAAWSDEDTRVAGKTFYVRDKPGNKEKRLTFSKPLSLQELLTKIDEQDEEGDGLPTKVTFSETLDDGGVPRVLDTPAFGDTGKADYPFDDALPPIVYRSGNRIGYFRPLTGEDDVNRGDWIVRDGRLDIVIHTSGKLLKPTATVSNTAPTTKDKPTFSVSFSDDAKTRLKYRWEFGDNRGPDRGDKSPTHRYKKRGTYDAFVTVRGANGSYGRSDAVTVKVDKPPKAATSGSGGSGLGGTGGTGGIGGTGGGGYVPPYVAPVPGLPDPIDDFPQDEPLDDDPAEEIPVDDGLVDVEGYVLAGAEIVPGGTPETIPGTEASSAAPVSQTSVRSRIATWTVAALAIALLVGAGAASETRWLRNRLRPLRRRA